jgi:hypothetical protein
MIKTIILAMEVKAFPKIKVLLSHTPSKKNILQ